MEHIQHVQHVQHVVHYGYGYGGLSIFGVALAIMFLFALIALLVGFFSTWGNGTVVVNGGGPRPVLGIGGVVVTPGYVGGAYYPAGAVISAELAMAEGLIGGAMGAGMVMGGYGGYGGGYVEDTIVTDDTYVDNGGGDWGGSGVADFNDAGGDWGC